MGTGLDRVEASGVRGKPRPDVCVPSELNMGKVPHDAALGWGKENKRSSPKEVRL